MKDEKGNVLFLILIGIALFGALTMAVLNSGGNTNSNMDDEEAGIIASQIIQMASSIQRSIGQMQIVNGCEDTDISFHYDSDGDGTLETDGSDDYYNAGSETDCYVFHPDGGNHTYSPPNPDWLDQTQSAEGYYGEIFFTGQTCIPNLGSAPDAASNCHLDSVDNEPLVMFIPYIREEICQVIAEKMNVIQSSGDIPIDNSNSWEVNSTAKFTGSYQDGYALANAGGTDTSETMVASTAGCYEGGLNPAPESYHFYKVLVIR